MAKTSSSGEPVVLAVKKRLRSVSPPPRKFKSMEGILKTAKVVDAPPSEIFYVDKNDDDEVAAVDDPENEAAGLDDDDDNSNDNKKKKVVVCAECGLAERAEEIVICSKCEEGFHGICVRSSIVVRAISTTGSWICPSCSGFKPFYYSNRKKGIEGATSGGVNLV